MVFENPDLKEGVNYRIPSAARFKEWRSFLGPVCHYISVSVIKLAVRTHLLHDATTKDGISVFQTTARVEVPRKDGEGTIWVEMPVKFDLLPSGDAETEAKLVEQSLHSDLGDGVHTSLVGANVVSSTSDNAARKTSRVLADLKEKEVEMLKQMSDAALQQAPAELQEAAQAWLDMGEEQQKVAHQCHELGCTGHSVNLTIDDSHKKTEKAVLEKNVERDLATAMIQRWAWQITRGPKWSASAGPFWCKHARSLRQREAGKHLDKSNRKGGPTDLPDISALTIQLSKAFSSSGDDAQYYLNESRHLAEWAETNGYTLVKVPARKGSRQGWTVAVGTALMLNASVYTKYMDAVRADDADLNKLIERSWDGVRDKYAISALSARSFIDVTFAIPLNFFIHSKFVGRHDIRSVMDCVEAWITDLEKLDDVGLAKPPLVDSLTSLILAKHPGWRAAYDVWYAAEGEGLEQGYKTATGNDRWHHVSAHLRASAKPMLATHIRNLDKDCSGFVELLNAPCLSDVVESGFGCFDYALTKTKASVESAMGVGHSMKTKAMANKAELEIKARRQVANKRHGGGVGGESEVQELLEKWQLLNWRQQLPREERWKVIRSLQYHLRIHSAQRRDKRRELAKCAVARKVAGVSKSDNRRLRRIANYLKHAQVEPIISVRALTQLKTDHKDAPSALALALRDQIRVRQHVYGMSDLPSIGSGSDDAELTRLEEAIRTLVKAKKLPDKLNPSPEFRAAVAAPTSDANDAHQRHLKATVKAYRELIALTEHGIFRLPRGDDGDGGGDGTGSGGGSTSTSTSTSTSISTSTSTGRKRRRTTAVPGSRKRLPRRVKASEASLVGEMFQDDGIDWKVLDVAWSDEYEEVLVWYYDVRSVEAEGLLEEELLESFEEGSDCSNVEHVDYSKVSEVRAWLKKSAQGRG